MEERERILFHILKKTKAIIESQLRSYNEMVVCVALTTFGQVWFNIFWIQLKTELLRSNYIN